MEIKEYVVPDGVRVRKLTGVKLAESTSRAPGKLRWVEFGIYKTVKGQYVVGRVGFSLFYHSQDSEDCDTVSRNHLSPVDGLTLSSSYAPCQRCSPSRLAEDGVFPEVPRSKAWICPDAPAVIVSLMKKDKKSGVEYLTNVAKDLLLEASKYDEELEQAFLVDYID